MRTIPAICLLLFQIIRVTGISCAAEKPAIDYAKCHTCHENIEIMDENHDFPCEQCHLMPKNRHTIIPNHNLIVRYPASLQRVDLFCGRCHAEEIERLQHSLHWTLAGMINQTRFLWGAQPDPGTHYGAVSVLNLPGLPDSPAVVKEPGDLVDDLLRRRCLSCHIGAVPQKKGGMFRGVGCAACHVPFADDGRYRGGDKTLQGKTGYAMLHVFCKPIPTGQCLSCHNGPRVGADYSGLFQHDFHQSYRTPIKNGYLPQQKYLMDHHRLKADVHFEKGLHCVDCHDQGDVMGRGPMVAGEKDAVFVRCRSCHDLEDADEKTSELTRRIGKIFTSRTGKRYHVPVRDPSIAAHAIPGMEKVHCLGCHSSWGFTDYGPSLIRDDRKDLSRWSPWRLQGDAAVAEQFDVHGRFLGPKGGSAPGPWLTGWRFRRWEYLTLGKDNKGRIVPFRPHYQYRVSYVNANGRVVLDDVIPKRGDEKERGWAFMPYYPHTVQKRGRSCESCHGQSLAAGYGLWEGQGPDLSLTKASPPIYPSMALLSKAETKSILQKTEAYRKWRLKTLWWDYNGQQKSSP